MSKQSAPGEVPLGAGFLPPEGPTLLPAEDKMFSSSCRVLPHERPATAQEKIAVLLARPCILRIWDIVPRPCCALHFKLPFLRLTG